MTIPVTLNYHASGIKYQEYSGDIGVGWSVNVGGYRVTREQHGEADNGYFIESWYDKELLDSLWRLPDKAHRDGYLMTLKTTETAGGGYDRILYDALIF